MNKRVLLPTDFSKNALNAIRYALNLYEDVHCDFYFLNAFHTKGYSLDSLFIPEPGEPNYEEAKQASEKNMNRLLEVLRFHPQNDKHVYHTICTYNSLLMATENLLNTKDIDIIIMGTKGVTDESNAVLGTNSIIIMEKITQCPVLAIPSEFNFTSLKEIVFPTDYKTPFKRKKLDSMFEIAKLHNTSIRVLHIEKSETFNNDQEDNKVLLTEMLHNIDHSFHTLSKVGINQGVETFIESRNSDMIAFLNRKHRFFSSILSNPLIKELGYYSKIPILVLKDNF
ncbi:universal stress protein [Kriegella sp. EG-1]|nr:universal stress protein [Flavobacteriaceae bacterium EG-1]